MFEYVSSIAGGALGVASSMLALSGGGTKALSNSSKAMSIHVTQSQSTILSGWHNLRIEHFQFQRELFDERSSRHDIDCKIDQLKLLTENGMWMSGFAIACFVELPIPDNADSGFLGFRMMVLFAVAVGITVFLFSTCRYACYSPAVCVGCGGRFVLIYNCLITVYLCIVSDPHC